MSGDEKPDTSHLDFPAVANAGVPIEVAKELAQGLTVLFSGVKPNSALSIMLTTVLRVAAKMLPRKVLDGIYAYETDQVYGPRERVRAVPPRPNPRRPRR